MINTTEERYNYIQSKIKTARENNNTKQLKLWKNKLEEWQFYYGAYTPIK